MKEKEFLPAVHNRLGIAQLNEMQKQLMALASEQGDVILLAPTGSGKTLAFILPLLKLMKPSTGRVQAVIIAPTRELVLQIYDILQIVSGTYHVAALYGGHKVEDEMNSLKAAPDIIVATPGRLLDHSKRGNVELLPVRILVLDEFDKALELGFEKDMSKIIGRMKNLSKRFLTSATDMVDIPEFTGLNNAKRISYLKNNDSLKERIRIHRVDASDKDKLSSLYNLLQNIEITGKEKTIVFVNHRESAQRIHQGLKKWKVMAGLYHGALEQHDREKSIAMFNNGTTPILISTDLAARGLDIDEVKNIIHYHQPLTEEAYTHRNGRTARINADGDVYVMIAPEEDVKPFIDFNDTFYLEECKNNIPAAGISTLYVSAGKREKLSKGDIVGFFVKQAGIPAEEIGKITVRDHYTLIGIPTDYALKAVEAAKNEKIKGEKRKITIAIP